MLFVDFNSNYCSKYEMFTPTAKEECSKSLARVMEIQRQVTITLFGLFQHLEFAFKAALGHTSATNPLARTDNYTGFMQLNPAGNLGKQ